MILFRRILIGFFLTFSIASSAHSESSPDSREQLPSWLTNTYIGFAEAYGIVPFSNNDLTGYRASAFDTTSTTSMVFIGHYFNPHFAAGINLFCHLIANVSNSSSSHNIPLSVFDFSIYPTMPITKHFSLFGSIGIGTISRSGFSDGNTTVVSSENFPALSTGGGMTYAVRTNWQLVGGAEYLPPINAGQPSITYIYAGFHYLFHESHRTRHYAKYYIFHKHLIQMGGFSRSISNPSDINRYFTPGGYLPIFWSSRVALRNGVWIRYERNVFHTHQFFSFDWGTSISMYHSKINNTLFEAFSVYPLLRFWFLRSRYFDLYFSYSAAGPTLLTKRIIDNANLDNHFIFQDMMGIGAFLGRNKHLNINLKIGHYSNGNLFPKNPGLDVPLSVTIGYAFK